MKVFGFQNGPRKPPKRFKNGPKELRRLFGCRFEPKRGKNATKNGPTRHRRPPKQTKRPKTGPKSRNREGVALKNKTPLTNPRRGGVGKGHPPPQDGRFRGFRGLHRNLHALRPKASADFLGRLWALYFCFGRFWAALGPSGPRRPVFRIGRFDSLRHFEYLRNSRRTTVVGRCLVEGVDIMMGHG